MLHCLAQSTTVTTGSDHKQLKTESQLPFLFGMATDNYNFIKYTNKHSSEIAIYLTFSTSGYEITKWNNISQFLSK